MGKACLIQMDIAWKAKAENFARVKRLLGAVSEAGERLIILPEMFATGFATENPEPLAESFETSGSGETSCFLQKLADDTGSTVEGGGIEKADGAFFNFTGIYVPGKKEPVARFRKLHPFENERVTFKAGGGTTVFPFDNLCVAPFLCYDLRFPESFRDAVAKGAQALTVQASWPSARAEHWEALLRARAIENQSYVLGVNRTGKDPYETYDGGSIIFGPSGEVLGELGNSEGILEADISYGAIHKARKNFPALRDAGLISKA